MLFQTQIVFFMPSNTQEDLAECPECSESLKKKSQ